MNPTESQLPTENPVSPPLPTTPQSPAGNPRYRRAKKWFVTFLVVWLAILPTVAILQLVTHFLHSSDLSVADICGSTAFGNPECTAPVTAGDIVVKIVNIVSVLAGLYFFVGWVPVLIAGRRMDKAKKQP